MCKQFVWQQTELCVFRWRSFGCATFFVLPVEVRFNMCKKIWLFNILNIILPLFLGLYIYVLFRKETYIAVLIQELTGITFHPWFDLPSWIEAFLRNYLSDFLWAYSLTFSVSFVLGHTANKAICFAICACTAVLFELFQKLNVVQGTFDIMDIIVELIAIVLALQFRKIEEDKKYEENN